MISELQKFQTYEHSLILFPKGSVTLRFCCTSPLDCYGPKAVDAKHCYALYVATNFKHSKKLYEN